MVEVGRIICVRANLSGVQSVYYADDVTCNASLYGVPEPSSGHVESVLAVPVLALAALAAGCDRAMTTGAEAAASQETSAVTVKPRDFVKPRAPHRAHRGHQVLRRDDALAGGRPARVDGRHQAGGRGQGGQDRRPAGAVRQPGPGQGRSGQESRVRGTGPADHPETRRARRRPREGRKRAHPGPQLREEFRARNTEERDAVAGAG